MLNKIRQLFAKNADISEQDQIATEHLATAALLIEVMIIDGNLDHQELQSISQTLCEILDLTEAQVDELILLSREEVAEATSLYQFTREINNHFDLEGKMKLLTSMEL